MSIQTNNNMDNMDNIGTMDNQASSIKISNLPGHLSDHAIISKLINFKPTAGFIKLAYCRELQKCIIFIKFQNKQNVCYIFVVFVFYY